MNTTHAASALHASVIHPYNNPMHFTSTDVSYYLNLYASRQKKKGVADIKCNIAFGILKLLNFN